MPVVSALMVFHRDTPFLRRAIQSVLSQTWSDLELVLVDNGTGLPPDGLGAAGRDPRVRWVRLPRNEGIPAGHNAGVAAARGEFLGLLDYDDIALPRRFELQVARLRAEPALGLVGSGAETIDEHGRVTGREFSLANSGDHFAYVQYAAPVVTPAFTGRRELFLRRGYRAEFPLAADFDFLARASEDAPMASVPEVLLQYRRYSEQTTQARAGAIEDSRCAIRVLTARRRAGRAEQLGEVARLLDTTRPPAESCRVWARRNLAEGLTVLAAYHARRSFVLEKTPAAAWYAFRLLQQASRAATAANRREVARHFFLGPVRALQLRPGAA